MKRIEVRLGDVLAKMQDSMPAKAAHAMQAVREAQAGGAPAVPVSAVEAPPPPSGSPAGRTPPVERVLGPAGVEVFVQHIVAAERRAASVEAELRANQVMTELLRERLAVLEAERGRVGGVGHGRGNGSGGESVGRLAAEFRGFRQRFEELERTGVRHDAQQRLTARLTYDAALLCLCAAAGVGTRYSLGMSLPPAERARLTGALAELGLDVGA